MEELTTLSHERLYKNIFRTQQEFDFTHQQLKQLRCVFIVFMLIRKSDVIKGCPMNKNSVNQNAPALFRHCRFQPLLCAANGVEVNAINTRAAKRGVSDVTRSIDRNKLEL
ncbi:hypothetical protein J6590_078751 [Homalodisca vitripennis]|nr:hypothetical protein J6590_078751 [Homalodisca vitripennis]